MIRVEGPLVALQALHDVPPLEEPAAAGIASPSLCHVNSHIHVPPNFSAFSSVADAVTRAAAENVRVLGVSNYYDFGAYNTFARVAHAQGVFPLFGLEAMCLLPDLQRAGIKVNDPGNPGKMYLCGKGITSFSPPDSAAIELMERIRVNDAARMAGMVERAASLLRAAGVDTDVTAGSLRATLAQRYGVPVASVYLQERHVAQALQEALFARVPVAARAALLARLFGAAPAAAPDDPAGVQDELRSRLLKAGKPAYVEERFVDFDHLYRLVLALGGIPCYPVLADGTAPVCAFEDPVERLVAFLKDHHVYCAELIPPRNDAAVLERYVRALRAAGIIVLGGTEHNTPALGPLVPRCRGGGALPESVARLFWEGTCVVAAHQYRAARGQDGFVDADGRLTAGEGGEEARIGAFARLGAAVIGAFLQEAAAESSTKGM